MTVLNKDPYYYKSIRNITSAFGTLFNNISIIRNDNDDVEQTRFVVPLFYGDKNSWYRKLQSKVNEHDSSNQQINVGSLLPVMSFRMLSMQYNAVRKLNTLNSIACNIPGDTGSVIKSFAPVPYDFDFQLQAFSKNIDDGLQIVEQIAPFFQPTVNIKLKEFEDPEVWNDIKITLTGITPEDDNLAFEGGRLVTWTFDFRVTGNIYPPFVQTQLILANDVTVNDVNSGLDLSTISVNANSLNLDFSDQFNSQGIPTIT